jgi:hypothetical protein
MPGWCPAWPCRSSPSRSPRPQHSVNRCALDRVSSRASRGRRASPARRGQALRAGAGACPATGHHPGKKPTHDEARTLLLGRPLAGVLVRAGSEGARTLPWRVGQVVPPLPAEADQGALARGPGASEVGKGRPVSPGSPSRSVGRGSGESAPAVLPSRYPAPTRATGSARGRMLPGIRCADAAAVPDVASGAGGVDGSSPERVISLPRALVAGCSYAAPGRVTGRRETTQRPAPGAHRCPVHHQGGGPERIRCLAVGERLVSTAGPGCTGAPENVRHPVDLVPR